MNDLFSEEIALIIGGVESIGGENNEILEVEVYAPFNQGNIAMQCCCMFVALIFIWS